MARAARMKSNSGIYHIIQRGVNKQVIFHEDEDFERFLSTVARFKQECNFELYAYCIMSNHIHILIKELSEGDSLAEIIKKVSSSYVYWYNRKYHRTGHLFEERFKSEPVESEAYFTTVLRYVHQNPIKSHIVEAIGEYKWSSYQGFLTNCALLNTEFPLQLVNGDSTGSIEGFQKFMSVINDDQCMDINSKDKMTDRELEIAIKEVCEVKQMTEMNNQSIKQCFERLRYIEMRYQISTRQLSRVTGVSEYRCNQKRRS